MKRLRKILRRGWKPVAMAFVALTLALSLTVTTTQKAEANPLLLPPVLLASGTMPVGSALAAVSLTGPIGWGLVGLGALAVGLVATQDYWLPYVNGSKWGAPEGKPEPENGIPVGNPFLGNDGNVKKVSDKFAITKNPSMLYDTGGNPRGVTAEFYVEPVTTTDDYNYGIMINCKPASGAIIGSQNGAQSSITTSSSAATRTKTLSWTCATGQVMTGYFVGGRNSGNPSIPGTTGNMVNLSGSQWGFAPKNIVVWGDMWETMHAKEAPAQPGFDPKSPDTKYSTTVECVRADGTFFNLTAESTGAESSVKMPACAAADPNSHGTGKTKVEGTAPGTTEKKVLLDNPRIGASSEYPLCDPSKGGPMCSLAVKVDGQACTTSTWNCVNWRTIANQDATRVQCSYGPYTGLAVDVCNPMERAFEPGGSLATEANLDGNPSTRNDAAPDGSQYQKPDGSTKPGGTLAEAPLSGTNPSSNPGEDGQNCLAHGWSWNPVSWVQVPAQCAMQWAFVPPRTRLDATVQAVQPKLEAKGVKPFVTPFMENFGNIGGDGCKGPAINLTRIGVAQTLYPFDACGEPLAPIANGVNTFFSFAIILQGGMSVIRAVAAGFGFNWGAGKDED